MPNHRTSTVLLLPALVIAGTCTGIASAQIIDFRDTGQALGGDNDSYSVALGDLDGDGDLDAMIANSGANTVWTNDGTGTFTDSGQRLFSGASLSVALGDLDGDGDLDAMIANSGGNTVWINDGTGTFTYGQGLGNNFSNSVALGDLDGDGDLDAMFANAAKGESNTVWTNDGNGTFTDSGQAVGNGPSSSIALGDIDLDGDLDAFIANAGNQPNTVWVNDGNGTFTDSGQALGNSSSYSVALGDFYDYGYLDAMVANHFGQVNVVWRNNGNLSDVAGTFTNTGQYGKKSSYSVVVGDLDGDGAIDAMVTNGTETTTAWRNQLKGIPASFTTAQQFGTSNSYGVALGDLDGDGDLDAFFANYQQPNTVWSNFSIPPNNCTLADFDSSGSVGGPELSRLLTYYGFELADCEFGDCGPILEWADLNKDGIVGSEDLQFLLEAWGTCSE